jgi:ubiquitin-protein ligase
VDQAIEVCFDCSASMSNKLDGYRTHGDETLSRCYLARQYLQAFTDLTHAHRLAISYGLYQFSSTCSELCPLSDNAGRFSAALAHVKPRGRSVLWDAIDKACDSLIKYDMLDATGKKVHVNAALRIIVISDGEDYASVRRPDEVLRKLVEHKIVLDAVMVSTSDENEALWAVSRMSGGLPFRPRTREDGLQLFEQEAFLNIKVRSRALPVADNIDLERVEQEARRFVPTEYATAAVNHALIEAREAFPLAVPTYAVCQALWVPPSEVSWLVGQQRFGRILREVKYIINHLVAGITVYINYQRIDKIRAFFEGPDASEFAGKFWSIYITFPTQYPARPPIIRFVNIPYHPNISAEGRALFALIEHEYKPDVTLCAIIERAKAILGTPELTDPLQKLIKKQVQENPDAYRIAAQTSADLEGKRAIDAFEFAPPAVKLYTEADATALENELNDELTNQLTLTQSRPEPIIIRPADEFDFFD